MYTLLSTLFCGTLGRLLHSVLIAYMYLHTHALAVLSTGDKLETATCIAKSSRLVSRTQQIHVFSTVSGRTDAHLELNAFRRKTGDSALVIRGDSLDVCLKFYEHEFVELACQCPAVVVCRCSPTQKAKIVQLLREHTGERLSPADPAPPPGRLSLRDFAAAAGRYRCLAVHSMLSERAVYAASGV